MTYDYFTKPRLETIVMRMNRITMSCQNAFFRHTVPMLALLLAFGLSLSRPATGVADSISADEERQATVMQNAMIWAPSARPDPWAYMAYVAFRKDVELPEAPAAAQLRIFADTRYIAWINGQYVERGPCRFDPQRPEYDIVDVRPFLKQGKNVIVVLAHHHGQARDTSRFMEHEPGLTAKLDVTFDRAPAITLKTDASWRCNSHTSYRPATTAYSSVRDDIDARIDAGDWTQSDFDDSAWQYAVSVDGGLWGRMYPRAIPLLKETVLIPKTIVQETVPEAQGSTNDTKRHEEPQLLSDRLPLTMRKGHEIILDIGQMTLSYSVLDFDAEAGSTLEIQYAMRFLSNHRVPTSELNDAPNRYIARAGRQTYMSTDTFGCRYVVIRVLDGSITLHSVKMVNRLYPFTRLGRFDSDDEALNKLWQMGANTIEVCCEDAIVDCIDRERGQWDADAILIGIPTSYVALAGPGNKPGEPCYTDTRLLRNLLRQIALSQLPDGRLKTCRPNNRPVTEIHTILDEYSCLWVQAVREYYDLTGDAEFLQEVWPTLVKAMDYYLAKRTEHGLVWAREFTYPGNPLAYLTCEGATFNAYFHQSLQDGAYLAKVLKDQKQAETFARAAEDLYARYNDQLWDASARTYYGAIMNGKQSEPTAHAAMLALYYDMVPAERQASTLQFMRDKFDDGFPYTWFLFLEVLYRQNRPEMDAAALNTIRKQWVHMLKYETETTSEALGGCSMAHEAGAVPTYLLSRYVLGVRDAGTFENRHILIEPRLGDLKHAEGTVLTSLGPVDVSWRRPDSQSLDFQFDIPAGAVADVVLPRLGDKPSVTLNGQNMVKDGEPEKNVALDAHTIRFQAKLGKYEGKVFVGK